MSLEIFLEMGGYGFYVWTAYGVTFLVLLINIVWPIVQRKNLLRQLLIRQKREQK
jgi:heme exporter protein D